MRPWSIKVENQTPGTDAWLLASPATNQEIEGYADQVSVNRGETIRFFVNSPDGSPFTLRVFRMGWYGGKGGREMREPAAYAGVRQAACQPDGDGQIDCGWISPITVDLPRDWPTGVYLAKLTTRSSGKESYIPFTIRDDASTSDLLFQTSVATYQAYNNWGGQSLYDSNSVNSKQAHKVSFNRPYRQGFGAGDFLFWELSMLRFMEQEGYDVSYTTDIDTHARGELLRHHKAFLSVGHDEYWSWEMRQNVEAALENGVNLGFFGANACYWQIRLESDNRTIVAYKDDARAFDPYFRDPAKRQKRRLTTTRWRQDPVNLPEEQLVGGQFIFGPIQTAGIVVNAQHWVWSGAGVVDGTRIPGIVGYEVDSRQGSEPPGTETVMSTPGVTVIGGAFKATMTVYTKRMATVVDTGTMHWTWGLGSVPLRGLTDQLRTRRLVVLADGGVPSETDSYWRAPEGPQPLDSSENLENESVKQATRNILERFGAPMTRLEPPDTR